MRARLVRFSVSTDCACAASPTSPSGLRRNTSASSTSGALEVADLGRRVLDRLVTTPSAAKKAAPDGRADRFHLVLSAGGRVLATCPTRPRPARTVTAPEMAQVAYRRAATMARAGRRRWPQLDAQLSSPGIYRRTRRWSASFLCSRARPAPEHAVGPGDQCGRSEARASCNREAGVEHVRGCRLRPVDEAL